MPTHLLQNASLLEQLYKQVSDVELQATLSEALFSFDEGQKEYFSLTFAIPRVDPLAVLEQNYNKSTFEYYWENPSDKFSIAAGGELARIKSTGKNRFRKASGDGKALISKIFQFSTSKHSKAVPHLFGGFSFFDHNVNKLWKNFSAASFTLPEWCLVAEGEFTALTLSFKIQKKDTPNTLVEKIEKKILELDSYCKTDDYFIESGTLPKLGLKMPAQPDTDYRHWKHSIQKATEKIKNNEFDKIVLARKLKIDIDVPISDTKILNRLRNQYPNCYSFLIRQDSESSFVGCTPERLASFNHDFILTEGLAGSTSRGKTASEDAKLESELLNSDKNRNEHEIVLKAIKSRLSNYAETIQAPKEPKVKKLSNVQHLFTPITARIKPGISKTEVLQDLHPTPALGGFPREKSVPFIPQYENFDRGWYGAPIGWINANGDGEFAVAIRSGLIKKDEVHFFAGCGIVEGSDPQVEWDETNLKFIPMLSALEYATQ